MVKNKSLIILIFSWCAFALAFNTGQAQTLRQYEKDGDEAFAEKKYRTALIRYGQVLEVDKDRYETHFKYAEAARLYKTPSLAETSYQAVLDSEGGSNYPLARFWLATVKKNLGKYDEAIDNFKMFLESGSSEDPYFLKRAKKEIEDCKWAKGVVADPQFNNPIIHLDTFVNTPYFEFGALGKGDTLYFSSLRPPEGADEYDLPLNKVYVNYGDEQSSEIVGGGYNEPFRLHTAFMAPNTTGDKVYFTRCKYIEETSDIRCEVYYRDKKKNGEWSDAKKLKGNINVEGYSSTMPNIGVDEKSGREILYFVSDRPGGLGKMDMWYASLDERGEPSEPINFGLVNTSEDDISPFYDSRFKSLYFSSNGQPNIGGFDIYRIDKKLDGWSEVVHLGYPLNSSYDDTHLSVDHTGLISHFSSNRPGAYFLDKEFRTCCSDIYVTELERVIVNLRMAIICDGQPINGVDFTFRDVIVGKEVTVHSADSNRFFRQLEPDREYEVEVSKEGYAPEVVSFSTYDITESKDIVFDFPLQPEISLLVQTFDQINGAPLSAVRVQLFDESGTELEIRPPDPDIYENEFDVDIGRTYRLKFYKKGFVPEELDVSTDRLFCEPEQLLERVELTPIELRLPLALYFDNARPGPGTRPYKYVTNVNYESAFRRYYTRKRDFIRAYQNSPDLTEEEKEEGVAEVNAFFEDSVKTGFERLQVFAGALIKYLDVLEEGEFLEISIRGYASPLADPEYNNPLTGRRISSVRNYFDIHSGRILEQYIKEEKLIITELPFGESKADPSIPDSRDDAIGAIYSIKASKERRVEIVEVGTSL